MKKKMFILTILFCVFLSEVFAEFVVNGTLKISTIAPCIVAPISKDTVFEMGATIDSFLEYEYELPVGEYEVKAIYADGHLEEISIFVAINEVKTIKFAYIPNLFPEWCGKIGDIYFSGYKECFTRKTDLAFMYYKIAAEAGIESAIEKVGYFYENGLYPVKKDYGEAAYWYEKLSDKTVYDEFNHRHLVEEAIKQDEEKRKRLEKAAEFFSGELKSSLFEE